MQVAPKMGYQMSFQALAWAVKQKISPREKYVLIIMANYANDKSKCWPSIATLCSDTGFSRMTVARALAQLEKLGAITVSRRAHKNIRTTSIYLLKLGANFTKGSCGEEPESFG